MQPGSESRFSRPVRPVNKGVALRADWKATAVLFRLVNRLQEVIKFSAISGSPFIDEGAKWG